jgi:acyl carrier protein phosphodiesterase
VCFLPAGLLLLFYFSPIVKWITSHAYLSFNKPEILTGNLISDFVKGKKKFEYPAGIQKGILLHREIDNFTDTHPVTKEAKEIFRPAYRLYAGAFMDVVYDHFLATDKNEFTAESLLLFSENTYKLVEPFTALLPAAFQKIFPYMQQQNWLNNYQYAWGIERSMAGLVRRSAYLSESGTAFLLFEKNYQYLQECYSRFFPAVKNFVIEQMTILWNLQQCYICNIKTQHEEIDGFNIVNDGLFNSYYRAVKVSLAR